MGKQTFNRIKNTWSILLVVFFIMSVTAAAVSAGTNTKDNSTTASKTASDTMFDRWDKYLEVNNTSSPNTTVNLSKLYDLYGEAVAARSKAEHLICDNWNHTKDKNTTISKTTSDTMFNRWNKYLEINNTSSPNTTVNLSELYALYAEADEASSKARHLIREDPNYEWSPIRDLGTLETDNISSPTTVNLSEFCALHAKFDAEEELYAKLNAEAEKAQYRVWKI